MAAFNWSKVSLAQAKHAWAYMTEKLGTIDGVQFCTDNPFDLVDKLEQDLEHVLTFANSPDFFFYLLNHYRSQGSFPPDGKHSYSNIKSTILLPNQNQFVNVVVMPIEKLHGQHFDYRIPFLKVRLSVRHSMNETPVVDLDDVVQHVAPEYCEE